MSSEPVISKDQRAGRIQWSDIEVQIHTITSGKNYEQVGNFGDGAVLMNHQTSREQPEELQMSSSGKYLQI